MRMRQLRPLDVAGVGVGPFNMSVAALLDPVQDVRTRFFERRDRFCWHPGLLLPEATIQVSFLKDLVTLADPTSPYSFLSFLAAKGRMYRFLIADFPLVSRREFDAYLTWVAEQLPSLKFGADVGSIDFDGDGFVVEAGSEAYKAKNLVLGSGQTPRVPDCARPHVGPTVFHGLNFLERKIRPKGKRIAVIGGGQSGAEIVMNLLANSDALPSQLHWISARSNFLPLDDSAFVNEFFTPAYSNHFFHLPQEHKDRLLGEQKLASDGVSLGHLQRLYQRLYELEFLGHGGRMWSLRPSTKLFGMEGVSSGWRLALRDMQYDEVDYADVDIVILTTGFQFQLPSYLDQIRGRLHLDEDRFVVRGDFSIEWDGPESRRIYVQNAARHSRGVADPNLSLMAWRSATIINSLVGRKVYELGEDNSVFDWGYRRQAVPDQERSAV